MPNSGSDEITLNNDTTKDKQGNYLLNRDITDEEVTNAIKKINNGKSSGDDMTLNEYSKCSSDIFLPIYVKLFNQILLSGIYPSSWSLGAIIPILKK